jgi:mono/diheme cytochrome c family protein
MAQGAAQQSNAFDREGEITLKQKIVRLRAAILLGVATLFVLTACGGSNEGTTPAPTASVATATPVPVASPTPPAANAQQATQPVSKPDSGLLAEGKLVFEKTAGEVGCAYCHGLDGKGKGTSGVDAPPNRGKSEAEVRKALSTVGMMTFIKINDEEIKAVVAYLQYLKEQP